MSKTMEIKEKIAERIITMMEEHDFIPWRMPSLFVNVDTSFKGKNYRGVNALSLACQRFINEELKSQVWLTRTKIENLNGYEYKDGKKTKVRETETFIYPKKGSHFSPVVFWNWVERKDEDGNPMIDENGEPMMRAFLKEYYVINASQLEGGYDFSKYEPNQPILDKKDILSCEEVQKLILSNYKNAPEVKVGAYTDYNCYSPSDDTVYLHPYSSFKSVEEFASTLAHELAHSTGAKKRLAREKGGRFGDEKYGAEELVAEFTSAMVMASLGMTKDMEVENHSAYIKNWLKALKDNKSAMYDCISQAYKACDLILGVKEEEN